MIYLVTGPPAAGKSTWVKEHAQPGDITIDYDTIAQVLTPALDTHDHPKHVQAVTKAARQAAIDTAVSIKDCDVYVIHGMPSQRLTDKYRALGAQVVTIDPGEDIVLARCKAERPWRIGQAAKEWYATRHTNTEGPTDDQSTIDLGQPSESW